MMGARPRPPIVSIMPPAPSIGSKPATVSSRLNLALSSPSISKSAESSTYTSPRSLASEYASSSKATGSSEGFSSELSLKSTSKPIRAKPAV